MCDAYTNELTILSRNRKSSAQLRKATHVIIFLSLMILSACFLTWLVVYNLADSSLVATYPSLPTVARGLSFALCILSATLFLAVLSFTAAVLQFATRGINCATCHLPVVLGKRGNSGGSTIKHPVVFTG